MRTKILVLLFVLTIGTFGQTKEVFGVVRDTTIRDVLPFAKAYIGDSLSTTNMYGEFLINIPNYDSKKTYTLNVSDVGHQTKSILISDSTKFPLDVILFNLQYKLYEKPKDLRKYDANVKLKSSQTSKCGKINERGLPSKIISSKLDKDVFELTIKYYESCSLDIEPIAKFSSDTLFLYLNNKTIRPYEYCGCECCYTTKFIITGLTKTNFTIDLEGEVLRRRK